MRNDRALQMCSSLCDRIVDKIAENPARYLEGLMGLSQAERAISVPDGNELSGATDLVRTCICPEAASARATLYVEFRLYMKTRPALTRPCRSVKLLLEIYAVLSLVSPPCDATTHITNSLLPSGGKLPLLSSSFSNFIFSASYSRASSGDSRNASRKTSALM